MFKRYAILACGILAAEMFYGCNRLASSSEEINIVKTGTLQSCPNSTIEKMSNAFFNSPKWESGTGPNGEEVVNLSGDVKHNDKSARAIIQFLVNKEKKDFTYHSVEIDGEAKSEELAVDLFKQMCDKTMVLTVASENDVNRLAPGIWTCKGKNSQWHRFVFNPDKTGEYYSVPITADNWGKKSTIKWAATTGKYKTTGKRWFGVTIPKEGRTNMGKSAEYTFLFEKDDNILTLDMVDYTAIVSGFESGSFGGLWEINCNRGDAFPFSK